MDDEQEWKMFGACRDYPDLDWFPGEGAGAGGGTAESKSAREMATAVCTVECPVNVECVGYALATRSDNGIWGGLQPGVKADGRVWRRLRRMFRAGDDWVAEYLRCTGQTGLFERRAG